MLPRCPFCNVEVNVANLRDELSRREFKISGLCQRCQDDVFDASRDDDDLLPNLSDIEYE